MRQTLKRLVPIPLRGAASDLYWSWYNRGRHRLARSLDPRWAASRRQLLLYRDRYAGKRCFIIGNGPSLRRMDLTILKNEYTFGLNRIYLLFPELGFPTTFLVSVNDLVLEQCAEEIESLRIAKFITWRARRWLRHDRGTIFMDSDYTGPEEFSTDVLGRIFEGFTVTFVALQLAFHMGFSDAVLIGVDHNFTTRGPANQVVISPGEDPDHFSPDYFGRGFRWQLPDLAGSERAYRLARAAFEADGRQVRDGTLGGKLDVFPKVDFNSLFGV